MRGALRTGSVLSILTGTLHLIAHFRGPQPATDAERALLELMARVRFDAGGVERSTMDILVGYSFSFSTLFFMIGIHGLRLAATDDARVRREAALVYAGTSAVLTGLGLLYFPTPPIVLTALMFVAYCVAAARART
ncbi:MAG TPA: hypothetical protein VFM88_13635 [Vicinamibacteria bacterium]|nr:hypothetical protein [Vicinamibacteria bacterium]